MATNKRLVELRHHSYYSDVTGRLDPRNVYVVRARELAASSTPGLERFAYNIFGPGVISSLAFALDPTSEFKQDRWIGHISPMNRTRKLQSIRPMVRTHSRKRVSRLTQTHWSCIGPPVNGGATVTTTVFDFGGGVLQPQPGYQGFISDTTVRTRTLVQKYGEFELFAPTLLAPSRTFTEVGDIRSYALVCGDTQVANTVNTTTTVQTGPGATVTVAALDALLANERANATTLMGKHVNGLITRALPTHREFDLGYNIAELKDLPRMLRSTVELAMEPSSVLEFRGAGNQYLNYRFGWEATVRAVRDMLEVPTLIAKRVNYLLRREGQTTTFRSSMRINDKVGSIPSFTFNTATNEFTVSTGVISRRTIDLLCVVNARVVLPEVSVPRLRPDLVEDRLWGWELRPVDLYNLVPWTWLVDWFSGVGEYIKVYDALNADRSLINYGFLTYKCKGEVVASLHSKGSNTLSVATSPPLVNYSKITDFKKVSNAALRYRYHIRKDIGTLGGVKSVGVITSLSSYQQAIVGALLTRFAR